MKSTTFAVAATVISTASAAIFAPALMPHSDRHDVAHVRPSTSISLHYASNKSVVSNTNINVTHTMKYPSVILENIASVVDVSCSTDSVAVTFNDSTVFEATEAAWSADSTFILVTNHFGSCDPVLERGMFLVNSLAFDNATLVATASAVKANISTVAGMYPTDVRNGPKC
jgi:hypothetical protein